MAVGYVSPATLARARLLAFLADHPRLHLCLDLAHIRLLENGDVDQAQALVDVGWATWHLERTALIITSEGARAARLLMRPLPPVPAC